MSREEFVQWFERHELGELEVAFAERYPALFSSYCFGRELFSNYLSQEPVDDTSLAIAFAEANETLFQQFLDEQFIVFLSNKEKNNYVGGLQ